MEKINLIGLTKDELTGLLSEFGVEKYRTKQIWNWIYYHGKIEFSDMLNISKPLREKLGEKFTLERPEILTELTSRDGTMKWLLRFADGQSVEVVYIPAEDRGTLCISSQIGCPMGCRFCNTGTQGFSRNMTAGEIVQQLMLARDRLGEWENLSSAIGQGRRITNIVVMGMGEPLMNYDNVVKALGIINDEDGVAFSVRRMTLSTCGLVPQIRKLADDGVKVNLAISLHASDDLTRRKIMPIGEKYSIDEVLEACYYYAKRTNYRRVTFEYIMIKDLNDSPEDAKALIGLMRKHKVPAKFNLIPFNPWDGCGFEPSPPDRVAVFADVLTSARYASPVRKPRGQDIMAACGQLKTANG